MKRITLISAAPGDIIPGAVELSDPDCPDVPGMLDRQEVQKFFEHVGYGVDALDELVYLIEDDAVEIPDGFDTLTITM